MINLVNGSVHSLLPPNFKDDNEVKAVCYAMDRLVEAVFIKIRRTEIWSNIKGVDEDIADYLAAELRTPFYDAILPIEMKRTMVSNTLLWYSKLGTKEIIEEIINLIFESGEVTEWFEYDGDPYFFRINAKETSSMSKEAFIQLIFMINMCKNVRSWLESIRIKSEVSGTVYTGGAVIADTYHIEIPQKTIEDMNIEGKIHIGGAIITDSQRIKIPQKTIADMQLSVNQNYAVSWWDVSYVRIPTKEYRKEDLM